MERCEHKAKKGVAIYNGRPIRQQTVKRNARKIYPYLYTFCRRDYQILHTLYTLFAFLPVMLKFIAHRLCTLFGSYHQVYRLQSESESEREKKWKRNIFLSIFYSFVCIFGDIFFSHSFYIKCLLFASFLLALVLLHFKIEICRWHMCASVWVCWLLSIKCYYFFVEFMGKLCKWKFSQRILYSKTHFR